MPVNRSATTVLSRAMETISAKRPGVDGAAKQPVPGDEVVEVQQVFSDAPGVALRMPCPTVAPCART